MIRYSFLLMNYASYSRFSNWLALEFEILCIVEDELHAELFEEPIEGYFEVPKEQFESFLKRWEDVKEDFHMNLINRGAR